MLRTTNGILKTTKESQKNFEDGWERVFGKKKAQKETKLTKKNKT